jgi:hypothetical protein
MIATIRPKVIAFDFDQTIAMYSKKYWNTKYVVKVPIRAKPNWEVVRLMNSLSKEGHKVVVYTSRWWGDYNTIETWLLKHDIAYHDIICGRFKADVYICDKSINPMWPDVVDRCYDMLLLAK